MKPFIEQAPSPARRSDSPAACRTSRVADAMSPTSDRASLPKLNCGDCEESPLDFDQLVHRCMGNIQLVERLLASFEGRFPAELDEIEEAHAAGDQDRCVRLAHRLKGAAANVSAPALHAAMSELEAAARSVDPAAMPARLDAVKDEWIRFKSFASAKHPSSSS